MITLRFSASGATYHSLSFTFRVPHNTISLFVSEVLQAIVDEYGDEVMSVPDNPDAWRELSDKFATRWNFHRACGAIDGFSIMLLGLVDAEYKFIWVDVGANGSTSDCAVFNSSELLEAIEGDTLGMPPAELLPGDDRPIPYFFIGNDAFALKTWMMKPFTTHNMTVTERIFNYRLS